MPRRKIVREEPQIEQDLSKEDLLLQQIELLKAQLMELKGQQSQVQEPEAIEEEVAATEIKNTEYIKIVSLCPIQLNLATQGNGQGKVYKFMKFGEEKRIIYGDLVDIMENNTSFLEKGYFYILDKRVIRAHGLDDMYTGILTKEKIQRVVSGEGDAVALFKSANEKQKETISEILISKIRDGEDVDMNVVMQISRLAGIDILQKAEIGKQYSDIDILKE